MSFFASFLDELEKLGLDPIKATLLSQQFAQTTKGMPGSGAGTQVTVGVKAQPPPRQPPQPPPQPAPSPPPRPARRRVLRRPPQYYFTR